MRRHPLEQGDGEPGNSGQATVFGISYANTALNVTIGYDTFEPDCTSSYTFPLGWMTHYDDASGYAGFCFNRFGAEGRKVQYIYGSMYVTRDNSFNQLGQPLEMTGSKGTAV